MPRPSIKNWSGQLFRAQLNTALDWIVANIGLGGGATWGGVAGTLSDQTDLQAELDGKAAAAHSHPQDDITDLVNDLAARAPLASPAMTGTPTAPTAAPGTNTTQVSTTAFVQAAVAALVNSAPGALDTLDELAAAFGDDQNFAATVTSELAGKLNLSGGSMTGLITLGNGTEAPVQWPILGSDPAAPVDGQMWRRSADLRYRIGATNYSAMHLNGAQTVTGKKSFSASTPASAFLAVLPGVAVTAPVDGDLFATATSLFYQQTTTKEFSFVGHTHLAAQISDATTAGRNMMTAADGSAQTALLNAATTTLKGLVPAPGTAAGKFLKDDLTWASPTGGGGSSPLMGWFA